MIQFSDEFFAKKLRSAVAGVGPSSYSTSFGSVEDPISEGGEWAKNASNTQWTRVVTAGNGTAHGTQVVPSDFDDSYAIKTGNWGANYSLEGTVHRDAALVTAATHEIELNVRFKDDNDSVRGYEILFAHEGNCQCFRWNDTYASFTELTRTSGSGAKGSAMADGDTVKSRIIDDIITVWINAVQIAIYDISSIAGVKWTDGNPAIGFFTRPFDGGVSSRFCLRDVLVSKL